VLLLAAENRQTQTHKNGPWSTGPTLGAERSSTPLHLGESRNGIGKLGDPVTKRDTFQPFRRDPLFSMMGAGELICRKPSNQFLILIN
jgi:hypothetical protein